MLYNLTGMVSNESGFLDLVIGVNDVLMRGLLIDMFLIGFSLIIFISVLTLTGDAVKAFLTTGFISFVLALGFFGLGLLHPLMIFITLIVLAIGVGFSFKRD